MFVRTYVHCISVLCTCSVYLCTQLGSLVPRQSNHATRTWEIPSPLHVYLIQVIWVQSLQYMQYMLYTCTYIVCTYALLCVCCVVCSYSSASAYMQSPTVFAYILYVRTYIQYMCTSCTVYVPTKY